MQPTDDSVLLRNYCESNSAEAFAELVARHINLVYSVAVRLVANPHQAEEITQAVFIILANKAASLRHHQALSSWLFQATHLTANNFIRSEARRHHREQEAFMQSNLNEMDAGIWGKIAPLLDAAVARLNEKDRRAIVLRFYEGRNLQEVGAALGANEEAAKKRIFRALEKLRNIFARHGVTSTAETIAGTISANSVQAAPAALAKAVTAAAIAKGATASTSILTLTKGALKIMAWTKAKTAIVATAVVLLAAGTTTVVVKEIHEHETNSWDILPPTSDILYQTKPQVRILPTKFRHVNGQSVGVDDQTLGISMPFNELVLQAYGIDDIRTVFETELPQGKYDYIANLRQGSGKALQEEIKKRFGIVGRFEPQLKHAFVLTVTATNSLKLQPRKSYREQSGMWFEGNQFHLSGQPAGELAEWLEMYYRIPVVDQTDLTNLSNYSFDLNWNEQDLYNRHSKKLEKALSEIGFELTPTNLPVEMLVVEKAK